LPDFEKVTVKARGRAPTVGLAELKEAMAATPVKMKDQRFAVQFEGYVRVPSDGVHRFVARADDGVRLEIDGEKLFEDDGEHDARESSAEIALLRGFHKIRVTYFQGSEKKELTLKVEGPNLPLGALDVVTAEKR
jgi:hypothetical protein